jgi:hypothetical protein
MPRVVNYSYIWLKIIFRFSIHFSNGAESNLEIKYTTKVPKSNSLTEMIIPSADPAINCKFHLAIAEKFIISVRFVIEYENWFSLTALYADHFVNNCTTASFEYDKSLTDIKYMYTSLNHCSGQFSYFRYSLLKGIITIKAISGNYS